MPLRRAPALDSRFRGNDCRGVRACELCWWRDGCFAEGHYDVGGGLGVRVSQPRSVVGRAPRRAAPWGCGPPDHPSISLRANGRHGPAPVTPRGHLCERPALPHTGHPSTGSGRTVFLVLRLSLSSRALGSTACPAPPLWIPAFAGMTVGVCGPVSADGVGGGGPAVAGRDFRERPLRLGWRVGSVGELGVGRGWAGPARHCNAGAAAPPVLRRSLLEGICANGLPCPTPVTLRQAQGERCSWSCACHSLQGP